MFLVRLIGFFAFFWGGEGVLVFGFFLFLFFFKWQMHLAVSVTLSCTHEQAREPSPARLFMHSESAPSERGVSRKTEA